MQPSQMSRQAGLELATDQKKKSTEIMDRGIIFYGAQVSWAGCIAKFWMHDHGWEYAIDGAMAAYVRIIAARSPGAAFNW